MANQKRQKARITMVDCDFSDNGGDGIRNENPDIEFDMKNVTAARNKGKGFSNLCKRNEAPKKWLEKPVGKTALTIIAGLIVVYLAYVFGWNAPKEKRLQMTEQTLDTQLSKNIPQTSPYSVPPQNYYGSQESFPGIRMKGVVSSNNGGDGIRIEGDIPVDMDDVKTENNGGKGINIIRPK